MSDTALIGGSGFARLAGLEIARRELVTTPYGEPSAELLFGDFGARAWVFLPRHGNGHHHRIPPHRINYRANIWALKAAGVKQIIALAAVGGIAPALAPGQLVLPDQLIDYTWGRAHTFHDRPEDEDAHIDFTAPYNESLRRQLIEAAQAGGVPLATRAVYAVTQGPRLETAAEVDRMQQDGADIVGMTAMPEAALAREAGLAYATLAIITNPAAGRGTGEIEMKTVMKNLEAGGRKALEVIRRF